MQNFPYPINDESDLRFFENFLNNDNPKSQPIPTSPEYKMEIEDAKKNIPPNNSSTDIRKASITGYLSKYSGRVMKVEFLIGNCLTSKVGKLLNVGENFIELKSYPENTTILCNTDTIKFATIANDSDYMMN